MYRYKVIVTFYEKSFLSSLFSFPVEANKKKSMQQNNENKDKACMTCSNLHPHTLHPRSFIFVLEVALTWHAKKTPLNHALCRLLVLAVIHGSEIVQLITCLLAFCTWIQWKNTSQKPINSDSWRTGAQISGSTLDTVSCVRPRSLSTSHARVTFEEAPFFLSFFFGDHTLFLPLAEPSWVAHREMRTLLVA